MKRHVVWLALLLAAAPFVRPQESPDDDYIRIYNLIQQGDAYNDNGQWQRAYQDYETAQAGLKRLQTAYPEWDNHLIDFRLKYLAEKLAALAAKLPKAAPKVQPAAPPPQTQPATPQQWDERAHVLEAQLKQAQADRDLLQAKLNEALSAQPAAVDPRRLAAAEEKVQALQKANDLLRVTLEQAKAANTAKPAATAEMETALATAKHKLAEQTEELALLRRKVQTPAAPAPPAAGEQRLRTLRSDNDRLKRENQRLARDLADARKEAKAGEERLLKLRGNSLRSRHENRAEAGAAARLADEEIALLRARLAVFEEKKAPYTPEELALFKNQATHLPPAQSAAGAPANPPPAGTRAISPEAKTLLAEADQLSNAGQYAEAEKDYRQVLKLDADNQQALAQMAAVQLEQGHQEEAEANLKRALVLAPSDPYTLYVLGALRYHQGKYDQALDALSRSVKINPRKAVAQNLLGVVLIQKGFRDQAETAFRKAIQLVPDYAEAHLNLARLYASHQPPLWALAQWHYQKALDAGAARDPSLEKFFKENPGAAETRP